MRKLLSLFVVFALAVSTACTAGNPLAGSPSAAPSTGGAAPAVGQPAQGGAQTGAPAAASGPVQLNGSGTGDKINHATSLKSGSTSIPNWGYGPWGEAGPTYPKIAPNGTVPMGPSQLVTDFNGNNWRNSGEWKFTLPSGFTEVMATTQGDAPLEVVIAGNSLTMRTNASISSRAPAPPDNTPRPQTGSIGTSLVVFVR